jgi:hypothetical protein
MRLRIMGMIPPENEGITAQKVTEESIDDE